MLQPVAQAFPSSGVAAGIHSTLVTLESSQSRGRFALDEPPAYGYLSTPGDIAALRSGVRDATRLMTSAPFRALGAKLTDVPPRSDAELDAWIRAHLGTAHHLSGTAPMGTVTDAAGRVHDVDGLRVGDISILPTAPSRGTALAAVLVAERIAAAMS